MKILDRYVARELLGPFLFGLALFITVLVSGEYLLKLTALIARGAPFLPVAELFALRVVTVSVITLPMATLLAALLAFGRLSSDSELIAMQAGGIPVRRIAWAAITFGLLVSVLGLVLNEWVIPPAGRQARKIEEVVVTGLRNELVSGLGGGKAYVVQDFENRQLSRVVIARRFDPTAGRMEGVTYLQFGEGRLKAVVESKAAEWIQSNQWRFLEARITAVGPVGGDKSVRVEGIPQATVLILNKTPDQISKDLKKPEELNYGEMREYIAELKRQGVPRRVLRELEVGLHNKIAMPFTSLVFVLIGAPLGIRRQRSGAAVGVGVSILIIFAYYVLWHSMAILGENGRVLPLFASWFANMVGLAVGFVLILRAGR